MTTVEQLNHWPESQIVEALSRCCGASRWVRLMVEARPFFSDDDLFAKADRVWATMQTPDILEAFRHHPRIGDVESLRKKFATTAVWAAGEQQGVQRATEEVLTQLAEGNRAYEIRFGYIFIVCASGKSAEEMLALLQSRLPNAPETELLIAAGEQCKITRIRLEKLLNS